MGPVLLNIDAGETPDEPERLFELAHLVSIACGGHAGDARSMDQALALCKRFGTRAGAHPSFADREGFGRRVLQLTPDALEQSVADQVGALAVAAARAGVALAYVKPHGALYHACDREGPLAEAVVRASLRALGHAAFTVIGPAGGALSRAAHAHALPFAREGFADRGVRPDGSLVPRGEPGALVTDPDRARARAQQLSRSGEVETICVHADTPCALAIATAVREELDASPG
jgi:UPF0271 protein